MADKLQPAFNGQAKLSDIFDELRETLGWESLYADEYYQSIIDAGFNSATLKRVFVLAQLAKSLGPISVRGCLYRAVQAGAFPGTDKEWYRCTCTILLKLRRKRLLPYSKISDSTRRRLRPSSWSGLTDFMDAVSDSYRKNLWAEQPDYVEVFCEKDAMSGVIEPATREFDVVLNVVRGDSSETLLWNIAEVWNRVRKPITAYYLGDHDPSGLRIEATLRRKLQEFCKRPFSWKRLAITAGDFFDTGTLGFRIKGDRSKKVWHTKNDAYVSSFGDRCVEVDALSPDMVRERVKQAIESHIDKGQWERLKAVEALERESVQQFVLAQKAGGET